MRDLPKTSPFFRTIYIVNAKGSGVGEKRCSWTFTVDATIYTFSPIDTERFNAMAYVCWCLSEWLINEFGFHNSTFNTVGGEIDAIVSSKDSKGLGFYFCQVDVEDVTMAKGDYRSRQDLNAVNAGLLDESCQRESYSIRGCEVVPRLAPDIRLLMSEIIRELIKRGLRRFHARLVGR